MEVKRVWMEDEEGMDGGRWIEEEEKMDGGRIGDEWCMKRG